MPANVQVFASSIVLAAAQVPVERAHGGSAILQRIPDSHSAVQESNAFGTGGASLEGRR
jgi:hypothetical protein